jgi:hypothetical protein
MMPYLISAVVLLIVAFMTSRVTKVADEKMQEDQPKQETDLEKAAQKEMETA